jgi:hypothetical protein
MAEIVLVHGIDQQQKSADSLEAAWLPALAGGVRIAGFPGIADRIWRRGNQPGTIETRMAFYGHLFLTPGQQGDDPGELTAAEADFADRLGRQWLQHGAERATKQKSRATAARELAFVQRSVAQEQGMGSALRWSLKSLAKISWFAPYGMGFAERFVNRALAQVTHYLTDDMIRSAALDAVSQLVGPETKVLIGHSLGSVVAFEAAHRLGRPLPLLLTMGSPLGLQTIVYQRVRPQPPTFPPQVARWVNVADRDDFIAAEPDLSPMFADGMPTGSRFEGGYTVDNGAQPHNADFYLSKAEVGHEVGRACCGEYQ